MFSGAVYVNNHQYQVDTSIFTSKMSRPLSKIRLSDPFHS